MNDINKRFANLRAGLDTADPRLFRAERELREAIGAAVDSLSQKAQALGLRPCNSDGAHNVEATIWAWLTKEHPTKGIIGFGATLEGIGEHGIPAHSQLHPNNIERYLTAFATATATKQGARTHDR